MKIFSVKLILFIFCLLFSNLHSLSLGLMKGLGYLVPNEHSTLVHATKELPFLAELSLNTEQEEEQKEQENKLPVWILFESSLDFFGDQIAINKSTQSRNSFLDCGNLPIFLKCQNLRI